MRSGDHFPLRRRRTSTPSPPCANAPTSCSSSGACFPAAPARRRRSRPGSCARTGRSSAKLPNRSPPAAAIEASAAHPWVSRGGLKLAAALDAFALDPEGLACLDVGASTGGFTDVLLTRGARRVVAVDVGHGQLDARMRADPRVASLEGVDARRLTADLSASRRAASCATSASSRNALSCRTSCGLGGSPAWLVSLVKPQFEVGRARLVKGAVKDAAALAEACEAVRACVEALGWTSLGADPVAHLGRRRRARIPVCRAAWMIWLTRRRSKA